MNRVKRIKAAPFTLWLIPGFVISVSLFVLSVLLLAAMPWGIFGGGGPGPPEPLDLPLVPGAVGWFVLLFTVGFTGIGIWLDRGIPRRIDPIARLAACLSVLGIAEAISVANIMASDNVWPADLIDVIWWILIAATAVGVISLVRLLVARGELRGWVFAICSVACSACTLWHVNTGLVNYYKPLPDDGIDLPVVFHSWQDSPDPDEFRPELRIGVDGPEELPDFAEIAERMVKETWTPPDGTPIELPDEPVLIRADAGASWASVRDVIAKVAEVKIWRVQIAARWEDPPTQTHLSAYLPGMVIHDPEAVPPPPPHHVGLQRSGRSSLDGKAFETTGALVAHLGELRPDRRLREPRGVRIDPDDDALWQDVLSVVEAWASRHGADILLGEFPVWVE